VNINLTLIGQSLTFLVFVFFCMKFVWPALLGVMQEREARIAQGLDNAEKADKDRELAKKSAVEHMKEAKGQAATIVEQANKRANQIVEEAKEAAIVEADRIKAQAEAEVDRQVSQAREDLRAKVSQLAVAGAEKILGSSIDAKAHNAMLEKLAAEL
tara:strand:- start:16 stop:486 length:471 start_codon:yes stop_codon:yes gene_type:complete